MTIEPKDDFVTERELQPAPLAILLTWHPDAIDPQQRYCRSTPNAEIKTIRTD